MNPPRRINALGATALIIGATGIGLAPILVRLSETGPVATAFYRLALAQPIIWLLLKREQNRDNVGRAEQKSDRVGRVAPRAPRAQDSLPPTNQPSNVPTSPASSPSPRGDGPPQSPPQPTTTQTTTQTQRDFFLAALAGLFFTADLSIWHWSLRLTTVANSTFVTNLTPFFVTIAAWLLYRERVTPRLLTGMLIAFSGGSLMVAESLHLSPRFLIGDLLALLAAIFYSGYLLVVKQLRRGRSTWYVMAWTGIFAAPTMFLISAATHETLLPKTLFGWAIVLALALISQLGGQGMIAYGLAHLSASVSAVMLMWQPVVAALLAWWILHEPLTPIRAIGGIVIIMGIVVGTWRPSE